MSATQHPPRCPSVYSGLAGAARCFKDAGHDGPHVSQHANWTQTPHPEAWILSLQHDDTPLANRLAEFAEFLTECSPHTREAFAALVNDITQLEQRGREGTG